MLRSHPRNRSTFRPSLEALETREVLNCTFTVDGTTLTIQAASGGSTITITDNGTGFGNNITAQCKGENAKTFASIQTLNFIGSNNKDKVTYNIVAPNGFSAARFININPMGGNDIINFNANNVNLVANSNLNVNIQQGTDAPTINASYSGVIGSLNTAANLTFVATAGLSPSVICGQFQINSGSIGTAIVRVAEKGGLIARGFRVPIEHLDRIKIPVIARVSIRGRDHFLVFKGAQNGRIFVADPAFGNGSYRLAAFEKIWSGLMIGFIRSGENPQGHELLITERDQLGEEWFRVAQRNHRSVRDLAGPNMVTVNISLLPPQLERLVPGLDPAFPNLVGTRIRF